VGGVRQVGERAAGGADERAAECVGQRILLLGRGLAPVAAGGRLGGFAEVDVRQYVLVDRRVDPGQVPRAQLAVGFERGQGFVGGIQHEFVRGAVRIGRVGVGDSGRQGQHAGQKQALQQRKGRKPHGYSWLDRKSTRLNSI